ncbi:MAG: RDD family protein [Acidimicrobiia bacterium]
MSDHYEELGVEPTASKDEIREAHRERLAELEAQRSGKNVTEAQLQANREEAAKVRTAWNVLSDPMQRQRYDQQLMDERAGDAASGSDVELVDDDAGSAAGGAPQPTGWRKLLGPPPAKPAAAGAGGAAGAKAAANRKPVPPSGNPNRPAPTVELPPGMAIADTRSRGMALLFDLAICMIIYTAVLWVLPGLLQSGYTDIVKQADKIVAVKDAQQSVIDAQKSVNDAKGASDTKSAQKDLKSAQKDLQKAEQEAKKAGVTPAEAETAKKRVSKLDDQAQKLSDKIRGTQVIVMIAVIVVVLLYLVPTTAIKGWTLGMRNRRLKVVRVDGSRCSWYAAFTRFAVPVLIAVALNVPIGPVVGLGLVLWGYRDRNGQGVHDKLARTLVVTA